MFFFSVRSWRTREGNRLIAQSFLRSCPSSWRIVARGWEANGFFVDRRFSAADFHWSRPRPRREHNAIRVQVSSTSGPTKRRLKGESPRIARTINSREKSKTLQVVFGVVLFCRIKLSVVNYQRILNVRRRTTIEPITMKHRRVTWGKKKKKMMEQWCNSILLESIGSLLWRVVSWYFFEIERAELLKLERLLIHRHSDEWNHLEFDRMAKKISYSRFQVVIVDYVRYNF